MIALAAPRQGGGSQKRAVRQTGKGKHQKAKELMDTMQG
jgi:hypothetical protein